MAKTRIAGTCIIHRQQQALRAHGLERFGDQVIVAHRRVLGDLEHQSIEGLAVQQGSECPGEDGFRRDVQRQVAVLANATQAFQGFLDERYFQFALQTDLLGLAEP